MDTNYDYSAVGGGSNRPTQIQDSTETVVDMEALDNLADFQSVRLLILSEYGEIVEKEVFTFSEKFGNILRIRTVFTDKELEISDLYPSCISVIWCDGGVFRLASYPGPLT